MTGKQILTYATMSVLGLYASRLVGNLAGARDGEVTGDLIKATGFGLGAFLLAPKLLKVAG